MPTGGLRRGDLRRDRHRLGIESNARTIAGDGRPVHLTDRDNPARPGPTATTPTAAASQPARRQTMLEHRRVYSEERHQVIASGRIHATPTHASHHRQHQHDLGG